MKAYTVKIYLLELEPENFHVFAKGKWKGIPVNMIIDTGASHTCFDIDFFRSVDPDSLIIANEGTNVGIGTSEFNTFLANMQDFKISRFNVHDFHTILLSLKHINDIYTSAGIPEIQCILGSDFFVSYNAIIDYSEHKMTLFA